MRISRSISSHAWPIILVWCAGTVQAGTITVAHLTDGSISPLHFEHFAGAVLNDAAQVAFLAQFDALVATEDTGLFRGDGGPLTLIAKEGAPLPGDPLGSYGYDDLVDLFTQPQLAMNDAGQVAFWTQVQGPIPPPQPNDQAVVLYDGSVTVLVARTQTPPPDGNGNYGSFFRFVGVSELGNVIFRGLIPNADPLVSGTAGIFFYSTRDPNRVADVYRYSRLGDPVDLLDSGTVQASLAQFYGNAITNWNDTGEMAHMAVLAPPDGRQVVYFATGAGQPTAPTRVNRGSEFETWDFSGPAVGTLNFDPSLNNLGDVAFACSVTGGSFSTSPSAVLRSRTSSYPVLVALTDDASPDGNGVLTGFSQPCINDRQQVAFAARFWQTNGGLIDDTGIIINTGGVRTIVAREGDDTPNGGRYDDFFQPQFALNQGGQVGFAAKFIDAETGTGIYVSDGTQTIELVRTGDMLEGHTITDIEFLGGASRQRTGFNRFSQAAYRAVLDNQEEVVALTTPELHWRRDPSSGGPGLNEWNYAANWTVGIQPARVHDVYVDYPSPLVVLNGPSVDVTVKSLTIGQANHRVTLTLQAGVTLSSLETISFEAPNSLFVKLAGGQTTPEGGRLVAAGDIALSGDLSFQPVAGSEPLAGQTFEVINSESGTISGGLLAFGSYRVAVEQDAKHVTATVLPQPGDVSALLPFTNCMSSPGVAPRSPSYLTPDGCLIAFDGDDDGDIDLIDFGRLQAHFADGG